MVKEYIEREAAIAFMNEVEPCICRNPDGAVFAATKDSDMLEFLRAIPAADVRPVRHGRWIKDCDRVMGDGWIYTQRHCSECGGQSVECVNYCQICGALMDKDGDGDV